MIAKRKLSVADFLLLGDTGVFRPNERVELLDGEMYTVSPSGSRHTAWVNRVMKALERTCGDHTIVQVQSPVKLSEASLPEPDVAVLAPRDDFYEDELPRAADLFLVVEVSLATLRHDQTLKLSLYAGANVPEYWIINLDEQQLEVYQEPLGGRYRSIRFLSFDEPLTPIAVPGARAFALLP